MCPPEGSRVLARNSEKIWLPGWCSSRAVKGLRRRLKALKVKSLAFPVFVDGIPTVAISHLETKKEVAKPKHQNLPKKSSKISCSSRFFHQKVSWFCCFKKPNVFEDGVPTSEVTCSRNVAVESIAQKLSGLEEFCKNLVGALKKDNTFYMMINKCSCYESDLWYLCVIWDK